MSDDSDDLRKHLRKKFGLNHFRNSAQKDAIKVILKKEQDVLISMPTGSRKSLCFQLPGFLQDKTTIVISPTSSAIKDEIYYLKKSKIFATSISSNTGHNEVEKILKDLHSETPETKFLYVTSDQIKKLSNLLQSLSTSDKFAYFAVDEAQYVSQHAEDFRQEYMQIGSLRSAYPSIPWIVLTQNASKKVLNDIVESLQLRKPVAQFKKSSFRKNLYHDIIYKNTLLDVFTNLKQYVVGRLESDDDNADGNRKPCGIIYCKNRETVELVAKELTDQGVSTKAYHGGLTDRKKIQDDWLSGLYPVITCTTSFGGGIDKSSVRFVVHWDVPRSVANYYKESGMAGRDGKLSYSRIYYCRNDVKSINDTLKEEIAKASQANIGRALRVHAEFLKMTDHCETISCRHKIFSDYFEDATPKCMNRCDVCKDPGEAKVAFGLFQQFSNVPAVNSASTSLVDLELYDTNIPIIKGEPRSPRYEPHATTNRHSSRCNVQSVIEADPYPFRYTRNPSPARTIIKEENLDRIGSVFHANNSVAMPSNSGQFAPTCREAILIKNEPRTPTERITEMESITQPSSSVPMETSSISHLTAETRRAQRDSELSGIATVIKQERTTEHEPDMVRQRTLSPEPPRSLSPARTIIKGELDVDMDNNTGRVETRRNEQMSGISTPIMQERTDHEPANVDMDNTMERQETQRSERNDDLSGIETPIQQERTSAHEPIADRSSETFSRESHRNLSPRRTIIKVEPGMENDTELPEIRQTQRRNDRSGIATPIKPERSTESDTVRRPRTLSRESLRSLSPTGTIIKDEPDVEMAHSTERQETRRTQRNDDWAGIATPIKQERTTEPTDVEMFNSTERQEIRRTQRNDDWSGIATPIKQERTTEPTDVEMFNSTQRQETRRTQSNDDWSGIATPIKQESTIEPTDVEMLNSTERQDTRRTQRNDDWPGIATPIKQERMTERRLSPTEKVITHERRSPDINGLVNISEDSIDSCTHSPKRHGASETIPRKFSRGRSKERGKELSLRVSKVNISEPSSSGTANRIIKEERLIHSSRNYRDYQKSSSRRSRSRSRERFQHDRFERRSRSSSSERLEQEPCRMRSRSRSSEHYDSYFKDQLKLQSTRERSHRTDKRRRTSSESDSSAYTSSKYKRKTIMGSGSRQRSDEKSHRRRERSPERRQSSERDRANGQRHRRSTQRDRSGSSNDEYHPRSTQPSTSTNRRHNIKGDRSVSSEVSRNSDESEYYGWEDPRPPKPQPTPSTKHEDLDPDLKEKMQILQSKILNEYNLDRVEEARKELFQAIEESIAVQSRKKLTELENIIQKKKDDYVRNLFGTDNFDSWDNDPALSNVEVTGKLEPFKSLVPDDIPLIEKMSMKHVINAVKLQPARRQNELVFNGHITEIENEFQGQEMPLHVLQSIKREKTTIAELVKQYLLPYYNNGRIEPMNKGVFSVIARKICHIFYQRRADENLIRKYIDDIFKKYGEITSSTNLQF